MTFGSQVSDTGKGAALIRTDTGAMLEEAAIHLNDARNLTYNEIAHALTEQFSVSLGLAAYEESYYHHYDHSKKTVALK